MVLPTVGKGWRRRETLPGEFRDIRAAEMANAIPILVGTGNGEYVTQNYPDAIDVPVYDDLAHFVRETLRN